MVEKTQTEEPGSATVFRCVRPMGHERGEIAALAEALADLPSQLEAVGIYIPGEANGQWADVEGLSFAKAEAALDAAGVRR